MDMNRRQFFKACTAGVGGSSLALLGFSPQAVLAETRNFKLARTTETRNTCPSTFQLRYEPEGVV